MLGSDVKGKSLNQEALGLSFPGALTCLVRVSLIKTSQNPIQVLINPQPNKSWFFTCLQYKSFENTIGKEEIARYEQFLLVPWCFLPICRTFCHFHET